MAKWASPAVKMIQQQVCYCSRIIEQFACFVIGMTMTQVVLVLNESGCESIPWYGFWNEVP